MAKEHKQNKIRKEIEIVELRIEKNKQERLNCEANMKLWNQENEENRVILNELKEQYNSMVGFTLGLTTTVVQTIEVINIL